MDASKTSPASTATWKFTIKQLVNGPATPTEQHPRSNTHGATPTLIFIGGCITAALGLYNNFPFLYPDSIAYLHSGIEMVVPEDRPIFYGLFLRGTHMMDNLFFSMLAQSFLLAYVLYLPFRIFRPQRIAAVWYLAAIAFLTVFTGYAVYAAFLMPDFFGIIFFITMWLLLFVPLGRRDTVLCTGLLVMSILVHNAHLFLFIGSILLYGLMRWRSGWRPISLRRMGLIVGSVLVLFLGISTAVHVAFKAKGMFGSSGHLFLTSRLNETGILSEFLNRNCEKGQYALCPYKDDLRGDFLWDPASPMYKIGGREAPKVEYDRMLGDMFKDPHTIKRMLTMSLYSTFEQFFTFEVEPINPLRPDYIKEKFALHKFDMQISLQNREYRLDFRNLNNRQWILVMGCFLMVAVFLLYAPNQMPIVRQTMLFLLGFLVLNAAIFGTCSTVLARYQGRVICLLPFMVLFWLPEILEGMKKVWGEMLIFNKNKPIS